MTDSKTDRDRMVKPALQIRDQGTEIPTAELKISTRKLKGRQSVMLPLPS